MPDHSLDLPMGISASLAFPKIPFPLVGTLAESVRKLFGDIKPIAEFNVNRLKTRSNSNGNMKYWKDMGLHWSISRTNFAPEELCYTHPLLYQKY